MMVRTLHRRDEAVKLANLKIYEEAQVVFKREAPWATLDHSLSVVPMRKNVEGFVQSPLGDFAFDGVDIVE